MRFKSNIALITIVGGWFRNSSGDTSSCGTGMIPCNDGGSDNYSAIAVYSSESTPVDSRLITGSLDLTNYTTAILEFVEGYAYSEDAWNSNMVEISTDSGATWDVVYSSLPWDIGNTIIGTTIDLSSYAGQSFQIAFRYFDATGYGEAWYVDNIRVWGGKNDNGEELPSGMYLYKLHAGSYIAMEKLVLLK